MATSSCPICKKPTVVNFRPFCSRRCKNIDLGRWLTESYAIPEEEKVEEPVPDTEEDD